MTPSRSVKQQCPDGERRNARTFLEPIGDLVALFVASQANRFASTVASHLAHECKRNITLGCFFGSSEFVAFNNQRERHRSYLIVGGIAVDAARKRHRLRFNVLCK